MALRFCKTCGTVYDDRSVCPKCETQDVVAAVQANTYAPPPADMSEQEVRAARKKAWVQLVIGIPAFILFMYLVIYVFKLVKGG